MFVPRFSSHAYLPCKSFQVRKRHAFGTAVPAVLVFGFGLGTAGRRDGLRCREQAEREKEELLEPECPESQMGVAQNNRAGYASVSPCFHLPRGHFGTCFEPQPNLRLLLIPCPLGRVGILRLSTCQCGMLLANSFYGEGSPLNAAQVW